MIGGDKKLFRSASELESYAEKLAKQTLEHFSSKGEVKKYLNPDFEPFDGDETEYISRRYHRHLDKLMGNE